MENPSWNPLSVSFIPSNPMIFPDKHRHSPGYPWFLFTTTRFTTSEDQEVEKVSQRLYRRRSSTVVPTPAETEEMS